MLTEATGSFALVGKSVTATDDKSPVAMICAEGMGLLADANTAGAAPPIGNMRVPVAGKDEVECKAFVCEDNALVAGSYVSVPPVLVIKVSTEIADA